MDTKLGVRGGDPASDPRSGEAAEGISVSDTTTGQSRSSDEASTEPAGVPIETSEPLDLEQQRQPPPSQPLHSVFTHKEKLSIVIMSTCAGFISPLSANIYFPALNVLSADLGVSDTMINLTLTSYMVFQGLSPSFWSPLADASGRRPVYIGCLLVYLAANIGLALQRSYAALFVLRCLQATGSATMIALSSGVVADIATSAERGTWMGIAQAGALLGPAVGPILGGVLAQFLGWQAIFWFLAILTAVYLPFFLILFPETGRNVVGDGSIPPPKLNMSLLNYLQVRRVKKESEKNGLQRVYTEDRLKSIQQELAKKRKLKFPNPFLTLKVALHKDAGLLLLYNSLVYTAFYDVAASTPSIFQEIYGFNELQIGLALIPYGAGCCIASLACGRLMDWNFRRHCRKAGLPYDKKRAMDLKDFPLETARLELCFPLLYSGIAVVAVYGWVLEVNAPLAAPLVLQFLVGLLVSGAFTVMSTMIVDLNPQSPSTATACNNLIRCLVGAAGTGVIIEMINAMGRGWCFTFIALVMLVFSPMLLAVYKYGSKWREERRVRDAHKPKPEQRRNDEKSVDAGGDS